MSNRKNELYGFKVLKVLPPKSNSKAKRFDIKCRHCSTAFHGLTISQLRDLIGANKEWCSLRLKAIYVHMKSRCYNEKNAAYKYYGQRGIRVCDDWLENPMSFHDWAIDNGYDNDMSIHRVDNDGNYCPENCVWIPLSDNVRIMASSYMIPYKNAKYSIRQMENEFGLYRGSLYAHYIQYGEKALLEAVNVLSGHPDWSWNTYREKYGYAKIKSRMTHNEKSPMIIKCNPIVFKPRKVKNKAVSLTRIQYNDKSYTLIEVADILNIDIAKLVKTYNTYGKRAIEAMMDYQYFNGRRVKLYEPNDIHNLTNRNQLKNGICVSGQTKSIQQWADCIHAKVSTLQNYAATYGIDWLIQYIESRL